MKLTTLVLALGLLAFAGAFTGPARADEARLAALPAPVLASPASGAVLPNMGFVVLNWTLPTGATQYQIQITPAANDGPGINLIRDAATMYTVEPPVLGSGPYVLLPGMSYTWRIRATDSTAAVGENDPNWGAWSDAWSFRTPAPSSSGVTGVAPAAGVTVTTLSPRLTWADTASGIFYYEIQLTKDIEFRTTPETAVAAVFHNLVHGGQSNPVNTWAVPAGALETATKYYWRVRPRVQGDGTPIAWSSHFTFETSGSAATPTPAATFVGVPTATPALGTPTATPAAGTPTATPVLPTCNWTGTWSSNAGGDFGFQQTGSTATGVFNGADSLTITGISGNAISGSRASASGWTTFSLFAAADCNSYTGTLTVPKGGIIFDLVPVAGARTSSTPPPIPTPAPASPTATPVLCNWTGNWEIKAIADPTFVKRLALTHSGTAVTGTIDGSGAVTGSTEGNQVSGTWSSAGVSGTFSYRPFFDCSSFIGDWDQTAPTAAKKTVFGSRLP